MDELYYLMAVMYKTAVGPYEDKPLSFDKRWKSMFTDWDSRLNG